MCGSVLDVFHELRLSIVFAKPMEGLLADLGVYKYSPILTTI